MQIEYIVEENRRLTSFQRERIQQTPFKWIAEVEDIMQILSTVLRELLSRWNGSKQSFMFREKLVPLSLMDICVGPVSYTHLTLPTNREV